MEKAAELVSYEYRSEIPTDGSVQRSSTGNGLLEGAFRLQFSRGDTLDAKKTRYDWTCTIQVERGGVQRSVDEFMLLAPDAAGPLFATEPRARATLTGAINPSGDRSLERPPAVGPIPPK